VALFLRLAWLRDVPPGVRFDELVNVKMADHIYAGEWPIYFQEAWGHEPLYHYFHALGMSLLGKTVLGVRVASILSGVLGVFTAYLAFREILGPDVASVSGVLLATSFWSLMYSRVGLRHISLPPWVGLAAYSFWRGLRTPVEKQVQGWSWFALGGASVGASLYTYFAGRVVPVLFLAFTVYLLLFQRPRLRGRWVGVASFFILPAIMILPMLLYLRQYPVLEQRLGQVGGDLLSALQAGDTAPLLRAVWGTLKMFSFQGDPEWLYNISGRPVFDPLSSIPFLGGILLCLWHWREPRHTFMLLWLVVGIAPAMLSWPAGSLGHTIVAQPVAFAFPALALAVFWRQFREPPWFRATTRALAVFVIAAFVSTNLYDYYWRWPRFLEVRREYQAPITAVARYLEQHPTIQSACVSAPYVDYWNPWSKMAFDLNFAREDVHVCWFNGTKSLILPCESAWVFLPDHLDSSALDGELAALLSAAANPVQTVHKDDIGSTFDLYELEDLTPVHRRLDAASVSPAWASAEGAYVEGETEELRESLTLPLRFGNRLSLLGYIYDQSAVPAGERWRVTTYWRVLGGSDDPLSIFVHVLDQENHVAAGWDGLDASPSSWRKDDLLVQVHTLDLPAEMHPGLYRVEVGLYSPVTLERQNLFTGVGAGRAPYDRAIVAPIRVE